MHTLTKNLATQVLKMPVKENNLNFFVSTMTTNNFTAKEIYDFLSNAWGAEYITLRRIQQLHMEYIDGRRLDTKRKLGSGRRLSSCNQINVNIIKNYVDADNHISLNYLALISGIDRSAVQRILKKRLKLRSMMAKWVPYNLTERQKQNRVAGCRLLIAKLQARMSRRTLIVVDEKWVYCRQLSSPNNVRNWVPINGVGNVQRNVIARRIRSDVKFLLILAINFSGTAYFELITDGTSVNAVRYVAFIRRAIIFFHQRNVNNLSWMHDNARPHVAIRTRNFLRNSGIPIVNQPAYSPDLNLLDRFVFRNYEQFRSNIVFNNAEEMKHSIFNYLLTLHPAVMNNQLLKLIDHCRKIVDINGVFL
jgi:hypothetical protein